ncbi:hypothetical protein ACIO3R_14145 [Streptomyces sp. NPDC087428]|uniref:hypothetical protein n=1 Tax=Streptomyces sp. NPDC087428 TaxID=3365788 RepID=UPI0037FE3C3D
MRAVYADRLIAVRDGAVHLVNDAPTPWTGTLRLTRLPGESTVFMITGAALEDPEALGRHPVLRCVNDTVTR